MSFKKIGYKSVKLNVETDWAKKSDKEPIMDREKVAYGQIMKLDPSKRKITKIFDKGTAGKKNVIDQNEFSDVLESAVDQIIKFYDKEDTPENREVVRKSTFIEDVRVTERPGSPVSFYVLSDAKIFDSVPSRGQYALQIVDEGDTLHTLADKYKNYLSAPGSTEIAHRARIAEILKANGIEICSIDEQIIKDWIASKNKDKARDTSFDAGVEIYLPNIEPPDESHPDVEHLVRVELADMSGQIDAIKLLLNTYKTEIESFQGKVENLNIEKEINLLDKFIVALRKHLIINDLAFKDVINDSVDIGFDTNYKPLFVTLDRSGQRIPLTKGLIVLEETSPFNSPRTMAFVPSFAEISNINPSDMPWKTFVETYIFPKVKITNVTPDNLFSQLQSNNTSVIEQLDERFSKTSVKTDKMLDEEEEVMGNPEIVGSAAEQSLGAVTFTGDLAIHNLTDISARIGASSPGAASILAAYNLLLNKISIESLMKAAVECLQAQFPFSCEELLLGVIESNIGVAANAFKGRMPAEFHFVVDEAVEFARTGDYEVFQQGGHTTEMQASIEAEDPAIAEAKTEVKFSTAFKVGIVVNTSLGYEEIVEDICAFLTNFEIPEISAFVLPVLEFPDDLPSVDIMASVSITLESAIIETIVGLILSLIESVINEITNACSTIFDTFGDIDFGAADLAEAVADKVGGNKTGEVLSDLFDSLGPSPDIEVDLKEESKVQQAEEAEEASSGEETEEKITYIDLEPVRTVIVIEKDKVVDKVQEMRALLENISALLTPSEISALFTNTASFSVLEFVLNIIKSEHPMIAEKVRTLEDVAEFFIKLSKMAEVGPIFEQVTVINKSLGCTWDSFCERKDMISSNIPDVPDIPGLIEDVTPDKIKNISDGITTILGGPLGPPIETFCEERQSKVDKGLIPKDNASMLFLIEKVVNVMYDGIYMAFDDEIIKLPDALDVIIEMPKPVPRTIKQDSEIATPSPIFDFYELKEKDFSIPLPPWFPKRTIINPEFQRLLGTGYVPIDGDPQGKYGPYTTEKIKLLGILPTPFNTFPLDPVTVNQKLPLLAANSRAGLRTVKEMKIGNDVVSSAGDTEVRKVYFALSEPFKGQGFKPATFVLKYSLFGAEENNKFNNVFSLQVGNVPIDPSSIPMPPPAQGVPAVPVPSTTYAPMEAAVFHTQIYGSTVASESAKKLLDYIQEKKGLVVAEGNVPQMDVFAKFVEIIIEAGGGAPLLDPPQLPPGSAGRGRAGDTPQSPILTSTSQEQRISQFVKNKMFDDLIIQAISGIAAEILNTPLFKKTEDKTPFLKIIDWAPIPTEEERLCGSDPHILALDTVKKRTIEAYEDYIECSPLEDEISAAALGRPNLSSLEAAGMTGCVMTTIRAYVLEQLVRSMYAVSVFVGEELVTSLLVEYFISTSMKNIKEISQSYHDTFLEQVEVIFDLRMDEFNPFGSIPDVIENGRQLGIDWKYADAALYEYNPIKYAHLNPNEPKPPGATSPLDEELGASSSGNASAEDCDTGGPVGSGAAPLPPLPGLEENSALYDRVANRVKFLAEEQLYSVIPKLQDLIAVDGTLSFDDNFLGRRLPLFDLQRNPGEARFSRVFEGSLRAAEQTELTRQYGEYLKEFEEFENNRLSNLLTSGIESIKDVASSVGASVDCLGEVFEEAAPKIAQASREAAGKVNDALSEIDLDVTDIGASVSSIQNASADATNAALGPLTEVEETFNDLTTCAKDALDDFVEVGKDVLSAVSDSPEPLDAFQQGAAIGSTDKFGNIAEFRRGEFQTDFTLTDRNGTIILEKYIKVKKKGGNTSILGSRITAPRSTGRGNRPGAFGGNSIDVGGRQQTISQVLCPRERVDTSSRGQFKPIDSSTQDNSAVGDTAEFSLAPQIDPEIETIYNIENWEDLFSEIVSDNRDAKFEDVYESWSFGVRMVYIAPANKFIEQVPGLDPGASAASTIKVPESRGPNASVVDFFLSFDEEIVEASKSFTQYEEIEINKKIEAIDYEFTDPEAFDNILTSTERQKASDAIEGIDDLSGFVTAATDVQIIPFPEREPPIRLHGEGDAFDVSPGIVKKKMERRLTLIPLSEVEIPIVIPGTTKLKNVLSSVGIGAERTTPSNSLQDLWNRKFMGQLLRNLKESPGYSMLFKYCAPSDTMLSFSAVYANLLNEMPDYFFDKTKFELKKLFEVLLNGGDYTFEGEDEKKSGGNRGAAAQAKGNMGTAVLI